jgi:hypothetical protein
MPQAKGAVYEFRVQWKRNAMTNLQAQDIDMDAERGTHIEGCFDEWKGRY